MAAMLLSTNITSQATEAVSPEAAAAQAITYPVPEPCPTCGQRFALPMPKELHKLKVREFGYPIRPVSHAEYLFTDDKSYIFEGVNNTGKAPFNGNPLFLPYRSLGAISDVTGATSTFSFWVDGVESEVNIKKGKYKRWDGQTYKFNKALFSGLRFLEPEGQATYVDLFFKNPRVADWIILNNAYPDNRTLEAMMIATNFYNLAFQPTASGSAYALEPENKYSEYITQYFYWGEVAIERLYGLQ